MKLTLDGLKDTHGYEKAGISIPSYDISQIRENTLKSPRWVHFGIGNIFRIFMGNAADDLIEAGLADTGIICAETFDYEVVDRIYKPYDNLCLNVTLHSNGDTDKKVIGSLSHAIALRPDDKSAFEELKNIFVNPSLQMVSFTITEKGYELKNEKGEYFPFIKKQLEDGPESPLSSAMTILTAMLNERFKAGAYPVALVSMDNVSQNGKKLKTSILTTAKTWNEKGYISDEALSYISDEKKVAFPWTMIDKITPRPDENVLSMLNEAGMEDIDIVVTDKRTYIAPFVNAEGPQYLVIEDSFPNGRPALEKAGFYMTDRDTVNDSERMKVTACLNPVHSALGPYGVLLGFEKFSDSFNDPDLHRLAELVGPTEGMKFVPDPKIISPKAFMDELMTERFVNPYIPDTPQRLCTDISQGLSVRFGVTIRAYYEKYGTAESLTGIATGIAGYMRYLLGTDDAGNAFELAPDPLSGKLQKDFADAGIKVGDPGDVKAALHPILSNTAIFGIDLYEAGIGEKIEEIFAKEIQGFGAVRKTLNEMI